MSMLKHQIPALVWKNWIQTRRSFGATCCKMFLSFGLLSYAMSMIYQFPTPAYRDSPNYQVLSPFALACFSTVVLVFMHDVVSRVMLEKTNQIREHLRIQSVAETSHAIAYLIHYAKMGVFASVPPLLLTVAFGVQGLKVTCILFACLIAAIALAYAQCAFFDNNAVASFFILVTWFAPTAPMMLDAYLQNTSTTVSADTQNMLYDIAAVFQYFHPAALLAYRYSPLKAPTEPSFGMMLGILFCHILLYSGLGAYLHQVIPSKYGSALPWDFIFNRQAKSSHNACPPIANMDTISPTRFESPDTSRPVGVALENVVKEFDDGAVKAVNGVSLNIYQDEVFALLGHNGAGKTTLLECIAGLQQPSGGRILINGRDCADPSSRQSVAVCPQFDAFYPNFKPLEILELYGRLCGQGHAQAYSNAENLLEQLGLLKKAHARASDLSGGQKRKLSVGLAFVGNCKTVVLDEPSSGLDLESSLELWSVIRSLRPGKTILLTTHNMSEAEALGDRIGIMSVGTMQCLGTPLFLKTRLGSGYRISFQFVPGSGSDPAKVQSMICNSIPNAVLLPLQSGHDLSFQIPPQDVELMATLLLEIESQKSVLNVTDYHLMPTRLEDVFLRIAREHEDQLMQGAPMLKPLPAFFPDPVSPITQLGSLLVLVWHYFLSDYGYHVSLIVPILCAILSSASRTNFFYLGYISLIFFTSARACSNLQHFSQSDIRLQLDIFGTRFHLYWTVIVIFNLIQTGFPFGVFMIISSLSQHDVRNGFTPGALFGFVFSMVGFMALVRSFVKQIAGWKVTFIPLIVFFVFLMLAQIPVIKYAYVVAEALQIHPLVLFFFRTFNSNQMSDVTLALLNAILGMLFFVGAVVLDFLHLHPNRIASHQSPESLLTEHAVDDDVEAEANRLKSGASDILQVVNLSKSYSKIAAVRGISVGVPGGQSLAFLGINGSGKSSSIRCMLGISAPSSGHIKVSGVDVLQDEFAARQNIGYVPQHDKILIGRMTGRQQLIFVARLSGVPNSIQSELVSNMLFNVGLDNAADRRIDTYSGGMKRKLCVALALIMKRNVVLLDEPSTGVDPASRRRFWSIFAEIQSDPNRCLVLTTHQLEEAEAVCNRISIMVGGRIVCLGSAGHLKRKFGNHYQVDLNARSLEDLGTVRNWFQIKYPTAVLVESDGTHLRFWVKKSDVGSLADLFAFVNDHSKAPVQDCMVGNATLDQIFISLAHKAKRAPGAHFVQLF